LLIHTLAHVHAEDLNEQSSAFPPIFHQSLSVILDLLFYLQCRQSQSRHLANADHDALRELFQGCESFEEQQSAIDDLFFSKVDSGRTQEGQPHDAVLDKRLKQIKKEFQQIAGDELFAPDGRDDESKLAFASMAMEGESVFNSVQDFIANWNGPTGKTAIIGREKRKNEALAADFDEELALLVQEKKKSLGL